MSEAVRSTLVRDFPGYDLDPHWIIENIDRETQRLQAIPARYATATITHPDVNAWVTSLVQAAVAGSRSGIARIRTGPSLLILGPTGTGKTHQAYGAIRALAVSGIQCPWLALTAADLYARLRPRLKVDTETEFTAIANTRLLILDDLGAAKTSEWVEEINYRLINHRYEHQLPTLITSNLAPRDLGTHLGERVTSRLSEMCSRIVLAGPDRRRGHHD